MLSFMPWIFIGLGVVLLVVGVGVGWLLARKPNAGIRVTVNGRELSDEERRRRGGVLGVVFGIVMGGVGAVMLTVGIVLLNVLPR